MIATMLDVAPDQVDTRATGEGLYSAFGLVFAGPRRYLDGHCPEAGPQAQPQLWVEVVHDAPPADPSEWRSVIGHNDNAAENTGRHLVRMLEHIDGSARRFDLILGLCVEAAPLQRRLRVITPATMHPDTIGAFITGSAMVCYFKAQQRLCLHAAVVARDGRALLICGPSGAGKSSLAAAMQRQGWSVVAEDLAVVEAENGSFRVRPGYGRLRLWSDSVLGLSLGDECLQIASGADKHYLTLQAYEGLSPPLSAIIFLRERAKGAQAPLDLQPIGSPANAMALLFGNSLAPYMNLPGEVRLLLRLCQEMVVALPRYSARFADDWNTIDEATELLAAALAPVVAGG